MARPKSVKGPQKDLRIVLSADAHARLVAQASQLDQTPASFARQVIMEKVVALEMAGSGASMIRAMKEFEVMAKDMEEERK